MYISNRAAPLDGRHDIGHALLLNSGVLKEGRDPSEGSHGPQGEVREGEEVSDRGADEQDQDDALDHSISTRQPHTRPSSCSTGAGLVVLYRNGSRFLPRGQRLCPLWAVPVVTVVPFLLWIVSDRWPQALLENPKK